MSDNIAQLESILNEEFIIFDQIFKIEEQKSEAIIKRDGNLLQKLCESQEDYLNKISPLEKNRTKITTQYKGNFSESDNKHEIMEITLSKIQNAEGLPNSSLSRIGKKLKRILIKIKSLHEMNTKLINDNIEFVNKIFTELKESISIESGYSEKGIEKGKIANSVLLDKKI